MVKMRDQEDVRDRKGLFPKIRVIIADDIEQHLGLEKYPVPDGAREIKAFEPDESLPRFKKASRLLFIPTFILMAFAVTRIAIDHHDGLLDLLIPLFVGFLLMIPFIPVHELIHAISFGRGRSVYVVFFKKASRILALTMCPEPVSRNRYISVMISPLFFEALPLAVVILCPWLPVFPSMVLLGFSASIIFSSGDLANAVWIWQNLEKEDIILMSEDSMHVYRS